LLRAGRNQHGDHGKVFIHAGKLGIKVQSAKFLTRNETERGRDSSGC
jgi:hypothetical protein